MITFDNVSKVYPDGTIAVDNLTVAAPGGKITDLVGPSGCGSLTEPSSGTIELDGVDTQTLVATKALNDVSAKLAAEDLIKMNAEAAMGTNLSDIATKWLATAGIGGQ